MAVPKYDDLMAPALLALHDLGGSCSINEMEEAVGQVLDLSENDLNEPWRGSRTKFAYQLAWARNYLKRYGLIENSSRGVWALTLSGTKTKEVDKGEVKRFIKKLDLQKSTQPSDQDKEAPSQKDESLKWQERLLDVVKAMPPLAFERLCQRLLRECGFIHVDVTGKSGDGGIDGKGVVKLSGLLSFHVIFQCKRYKDAVSVTVIRDFRGAMVGRADKGLIITTGRFTREARSEAQRDGAPPIDLLDGDELAVKLKELGIGVRTELETIEKIIIDEEWYKSL